MKKKKCPPVGNFGFYFCKIFHGLSLCESLHLILYAWFSYFALFLSYVDITKLLKFKMAAKKPFQNCLKLFAHNSYQVIG